MLTLPVDLKLYLHGRFLSSDSLPGTYADDKPHWVWWFVPVIPALRRLRQKHQEFHASLGFIVRTYLKKIKTKQKNR
jgi:hypothetical protein